MDAPLAAQHPQVSCRGHGVEGRFSVPSSAAGRLRDCGQVPWWPEGSDFQNSHRRGNSSTPRSELSPLACRRDLLRGLPGCGEGSGCRRARWSSAERDAWSAGVNLCCSLCNQSDYLVYNPRFIGFIGLLKSSAKGCDGERHLTVRDQVELWPGQQERANKPLHCLCLGHAAIDSGYGMLSLKHHLCCKRLLSLQTQFVTVRRRKGRALGPPPRVGPPRRQVTAEGTDMAGLGLSFPTQE